MKSTNKCLIESNAIVEALGQGKQSILIRNFNNSLQEFLLYPSIDYLDDDNYLDSFQDKYHSFVKENSNPEEDDNAYEVRYFATVEEEIEKPASAIADLADYHMLTTPQVQSYLSTATACVWLLRVYKLKEPVMTKRTNGMVYANTDEAISIEDMEPVLSDAEFEKIKKALI